MKWMEPRPGFEPGTSSLPRKRSTTEPTGRRVYAGDDARVGAQAMALRRFLSLRFIRLPRPVQKSSSSSPTLRRTPGRTVTTPTTAVTSAVSMSAVAMPDSNPATMNATANHRVARSIDAHTNREWVPRTQARLRTSATHQARNGATHSTRAKARTRTRTVTTPAGTAHHC